MSRSKSSGRWLREHHSDEYVRKSRQEGYRSRASYKLLEIHKRDKLFRPGMLVLDLGAAPGGWSQVAAELIGANGKVIACDLLPMDTLGDVEFIQGDFCDEKILQEILSALGDDKADLVISDMAPNMSGIRSVDQARMMELAELALELAEIALQPDGSLLLKIFQGEGFDGYLAALRSRFKRVVTRKPDASRARSRELYLLATGFSAATG